MVFKNRNPCAWYVSVSEIMLHAVLIHRHLRFLKKFCLFARHDKDMILRIIYDDEGKGMEHEPAGLSQIQSHMDQLGSIIYKYAAHIYTTQGLFIGSWGEMHTSNSATDKASVV